MYCVMRLTEDFCEEEVQCVELFETAKQICRDLYYENILDAHFVLTDEQWNEMVDNTRFWVATYDRDTDAYNEIWALSDKELAQMGFEKR